MSAYPYDVFGLPSGGMRAEFLELERQAIGLPRYQIDISVDAIGKGGANLSRVVSVGGRLRFHVTTVQEKPRSPILGEKPRSKISCEQPKAPLASQIDLPQSIAGGIEPLREEKIREIVGADVRHTASVDGNFNRSAKARNAKLFFR